RAATADRRWSGNATGSAARRPADRQPAGLLLHGGAEGGAGGPEPAPRPCGVLARGQAGGAEVQLQGERLQPDRAVPVQGDQEQQAEVVAQPQVDPVVVEEVAQVVQEDRKSTRS